MLGKTIFRIAGDGRQIVVRKTLHVGQKKRLRWRLHAFFRKSIKATHLDLNAQNYTLLQAGPIQHKLPEATGRRQPISTGVVNQIKLPLPGRARDQQNLHIESQKHIHLRHDRDAEPVRDKPKQKWDTDVTEFSLFGEKLYLSPILDLHSSDWGATRFRSGLY